MPKLAMQPKTSKITLGELFDKFIAFKQIKNLSHESMSVFVLLVSWYTFGTPYFMREGYMKEFKIELLKEEKGIKETYNEKELEKLLKKPNIRKCGFTEYRTWVLANYLFATSNRIRTALNIKTEHLDFNNQLIFLGKTKNGRQQLIPMSNQLSAILQEYLLYRKGKPEDYLFCSVHGTQLTRDGATTVLYRYHKKRGVEKTSAHAYRHTFAKYWILNGGDIFRLQKILGHSNIEMVRNYVEMFNDDLSKDFASFNPLDNFTKGQAGEVIRMKK